MNQFMLWIGFGIVISVLLVLDLGVFGKTSHKIGIKEALILSGVWILAALLFGAGIFFLRGKEPFLLFLTGYLIEKSLSVDNLFVFLLIFSYFKVDPAYQHKVLFWGILGAIVMRAIFIMAGISLINKFHWIIYGFGLLLILTGIKLFFEKDKKIEPEKNWLLRLVRGRFPVTGEYRDDKFFVREAGKWFATPLFLVLLVVESTDVVFAVDSIPAILAITRDPFIVYTSNIFAILGLRALYFALAGLLRLFHHLHYGLSVILVFIGIKMLASDFFHLPVGIALGFIAGILILSIAASLVFPDNKSRELHSTL